MNTQKKTVIGISVLVALGIVGSIFFLTHNKKTEVLSSVQPATSFEECVAEGSPVLESYPRQCISKFGTQFTEAIAIAQNDSDSSQSVRVNAGPVIKTVVLADGCFWCVESDLEKVPGVINVVSGYAGGSTDAPTYENYSAGGHHEVVLVTYDESKVSFANLVEHIIKHGDPTDSAGSFGDRGPEYAPAIYYENELEKSEARRVIDAVDTMKVFSAKLPLLVIPRVKFWPAEEYHQDYAKKNPVRYNYYRNASGRDVFIKKTWGDRAGKFEIPAKVTSATAQTPVQVVVQFNAKSWDAYTKPAEDVLRRILSKEQFFVTQEEGTEAPFKNLYDKEYREGVYVDIVSGEPLYLSKDKYDSGTGWPSFVKQISDSSVTLHEDNTLFTKRTEVRSKRADSHLGHVFNDGPADRGGKRYCMNSAALRFIPKEEMAKNGYSYLLSEI